MKNHKPSGYFGTSGVSGSIPQHLLPAPHPDLTKTTPPSHINTSHYYYWYTKEVLTTHMQVLAILPPHMFMTGGQHILVAPTAPEMKSSPYVVNPDSTKGREQRHMLGARVESLIHMFHYAPVKPDCPDTASKAPFTSSAPMRSFTSTAQRTGHSGLAKTSFSKDASHPHSSTAKPTSKM